MDRPDGTRGLGYIQSDTIINSVLPVGRSGMRACHRAGSKQTRHRDIALEDQHALFSYANDQHFEIGQGHIVRESAKDNIILIGAGVTLYECLQGGGHARGRKVCTRVLDPFTIKPLDKDLSEAREARGWKSTHSGGSLPGGRYR